jgi:enolase
VSYAIQSVIGREVLDSRGQPTVEIDVRLADGTDGRASVPSGASTGAHEAVERRDVGAPRHGGRGVREVIATGLREIAPAVVGLDPRNQRGVDDRLVELDGTPGKARLGANVILGVSLACARAAAAAQQMPLYQWIGTLSGHDGDRWLMPTPMVNILSGGLHARRNIDMQDFLVIPTGARIYSEALDLACDVYRAARSLLEERGMTTLLADEGGFGPALGSNEQALDLLMSIIERAGHEPGRDVAIAIDVASSHFYTNGGYALRSEGWTLDAAGMAELLSCWVAKYPIVSIEDGCAEDDWPGWAALTKSLGRRVQLIGDDLFVTNSSRLARGIEAGIANAVLVKMNQIGTLTETLDVVAQAKAAGYRTVISARSGETEDPLLSDLAVGCAGGQIKVGSVARSSRLSKWNQLLRIEQELGSKAQYDGLSALRL